MSDYVPKKAVLRGSLITFFHLNKTAAETYRLLVEAYGQHAPTQTTCQRWFTRFKSGDFDTDDKPTIPNKFNDEQLEALLDEDCCQTQEELALSLGVTPGSIYYRLRALGFIKKQGNWVPYELKPRDVERRFCMSEMMFERYRKKSFLHRIITGDEKWIHYTEGRKVMLCIFWDMKGVLYYELLKPGQAITGDLYRTQLINLKRAINEKRPEYLTRREAIIFHHDTARAHVAKPVKNYLENSGWEVLAHPPYSPDLVPSNYYLFRSMQTVLTGKRFTSEQGIRDWLESFFTSKLEQFFWRGIHMLPERWLKVVSTNGQYFE